MTFIFGSEMDKGLENDIKRKHLTHIIILQTPLLEDLIPNYIESLPEAEQRLLLKKARKWLSCHWNPQTQSLRCPRYFGWFIHHEAGTAEEILSAYLCIFYYALPLRSGGIKYLEKSR